MPPEPPVKPSTGAAPCGTKESNTPTDRVDVEAPELPPLVALSSLAALTVPEVGDVVAAPGLLQAAARNISPAHRSPCLLRPATCTRSSLIGFAWSTVWGRVCCVDIRIAVNEALALTLH